MTDIRWRAVLAPIGVPCDRQPTNDGVWGLAKAVGLAGLGSPPDPLPPLFLKVPHPMMVGVVDDLRVDGDPQLLLAGGYLVNPPDYLLDLIRDKRVHGGFDLRDVVGLGSMVTAGTFASLHLLPFDHPTDPYALWRPDTFAATFELVDDEQVPA